MKHISTENAYDAFREKKDCVFLDVRSTDEYTKGHIEGSVHIPLEVLSDRISEVISDKLKMIYVYCLSGARSIVACTVLENLGYSNVYTIDYGLLGWRAKKFPLKIS